jgi:RNA polymerase sigma-70 factor (ECF subfamily)
MDDAPPPDLAAKEDREWVRASQNGDPEAFDRLMERYMPRVYGVIFHMVGNHEDTNDLMMESFEKAYRSIGSFKSDSGFYTWLYRIAMNRAINFLRRTRHKHRFDVSLDEQDSESGQKREFMDTHLASDVERQMLNSELEKKLNESLMKLSEEHRAVVNLFDIQGLSHGEIGKIMGCSEGTVRSRLFYAHKQLQKLLRNYLE